ncbi:hypothetical protein [Bacillus sp. 1P06AnD]|uniref:hypothetical protein n=1 Tax=Bacillus sp. 1P06AnD TaxID=3132208 RepID=UPI0039A06608
MSLNIEVIMKLLLYLVGLGALVGIWLSLGLKVSKIRERLRINKELKLANYNTKWLKNKWLKQYHFLLSSAIKKYEANYFSKIFIFQFLIFFCLLIVLYLNLHEFLLSFGFALILIYVIPTAYLYTVHKQKQSYLQGSLVETSVILLQEYEKNQHHMLFALKETVDHTTGASRVAYAKLFARMHDDHDARVLASENFAFQLGHFRGKNLATIILRACNEGIIVSSLLEDLVADITEFNKRVKNAETEARETAFIGLAPLPLLVGLYFVNDRWLIPGGEVFRYQFQTAGGIKSFLISVMFGVIGIVLAIVVKKPKKM